MLCNVFALYEVQKELCCILITELSTMKAANCNIVFYIIQATAASTD